MSKKEELIKALNITLEEGVMPTDEQLINASKKWKATLDDPYRTFADKDFLSGAIWGIQLVTGKIKV